MSLTTSAKRTFWGLVCGNLLLIFSLIGLLQYVDYVNRKPMLPPAMVHTLVKYVHQFKETPASKWPTLLNKYPGSWATITYTETPTYPDNALLNFRAMNVYDALKHQKKNRSIRIYQRRRMVEYYPHSSCSFSVGCLDNDRQFFNIIIRRSIFA